MEDFVTLDAAYKRMYGSSMTHFLQDPTPTSRMQQSNAWNVKLHWGANIESGEDFRNVVSSTHRVLLGCWDATGSHWIRTTPPKKARNFQIASYVWSVFYSFFLFTFEKSHPRISEEKRLPHQSLCALDFWRYDFMKCWVMHRCFPKDVRTTEQYGWQQDWPFKEFLQHNPGVIVAVIIQLL